MSSLPSFAAPHQRAAPTSSTEATEECDVHHKKRSGHKKTKALPNTSYIMYFLGPTESCSASKRSLHSGAILQIPTPTKPFLPAAVAALDTPTSEPPPPPPRDVGTSQNASGTSTCGRCLCLGPLLHLFAVAATGRVRIFFLSVLLAHEGSRQSSMAFLLLYLPVVVDDDSGQVAVAPWTLVSAPWPGAAGS
uniref:Uncharacterized protein n=1 Tax=Oryza meridionalis TaxID=40149 RepID=A0A0E0DXD3_9ORYZ